MSRFQESVQVDPAALAYSEPDSWIRCHASEAKSENRTDVVEYSRTIIPAGTTGEYKKGSEDH